MTKDDLDSNDEEKQNNVGNIDNDTRDLFNAQQDYAFRVFVTKLKADKGKELVNSTNITLMLNWYGVTYLTA